MKFLLKNKQFKNMNQQYIKLFNNNPFLKFNQIVIGPWFLGSFIMGIINIIFCFITKITDFVPFPPVMIAFRVLCWICNIIFVIIQIVYFWIGISTAFNLFYVKPMEDWAKYYDELNKPEPTKKVDMTSSSDNQIKIQESTVNINDAYQETEDSEDLTGTKKQAI